MVKIFSIPCSRIFKIRVLPQRQSAPRQTLVNGKNSGRSNSPETNESGNYEENRRTAAIRKKHAGRAKNRSDYTGNNSHPQHRRHRRDVTGDNLNLALSDRDHRAIVIIGNLAAVQPRMERRARLGRRHQQPERQRQPRRGRVQTPPPTSIYGTSISQSVCNIAKPMPVARVCLFFLHFSWPGGPRRVAGLIAGKTFTALNASCRRWAI